MTSLWHVSVYISSASAEKIVKDMRNRLNSYHDCSRYVQALVQASTLNVPMAEGTHITMLAVTPAIFSLSKGRRKGSNHLPRPKWISVASVDYQNTDIARGTKYQ